MCGIAGFVGRGSESDLQKMSQALHHRGRDDAGLLVRDGVGLGHTRLSIIDLSPTGHQPMSRGEVSVVYNGEIYNFKELRSELENLGNKFSSSSDTEVIIWGYKTWGSEVFSKLRGMFAIALYDFDKEELVLARDPLGKKPLYWARFGSTLIFGSELKSLIGHPSFVKNLDTLALNQYFIHDCVSTPRTIWQNVYKLEPGTSLLYDGKSITKNIFWSPSFITADTTLPEATKRLDELLEKATGVRLVADVPLGIFLSGGIDSSTVAYYAQKLCISKIKTFSIGFEERSFDESSYAKQVANHLGTEHNERIVSAKNMLAVVPLIPEIFDEPVADASVIPTYLLSKFTRQSVTVALGGDGGDELFNGYQTFIAEQFSALFPLVSLIARPVSRVLPPSNNYFGLSFKINKFLDGADFTGVERHSRWLATFEPEDLSRMLTKLSLDKASSTSSVNLGFNNISEFYLRRYLMDQVLVKVDRASMQNSLEVRAPFLDLDLVAFANSLPASLKVRGATTKYILKKLMQDKLPTNIVERGKKGFAVPMNTWLKGPLKSMCTDLLGISSIGSTGLFNQHIIDRLVNTHMSGTADNSKKLWSLIVFQLWWQRWQ